MGKKTEFLYLSEEDMIRAGVLDNARCIDVEEEIFGLLSRGDYRMGGESHNSHGIAVIFPEESDIPDMPLHAPDRRFMAMPGYLGGRFHIAGEKWYGSNIANPSKGLPRSVLMIMLNDVETGEPIALMSGNLVSSVRTGCVAGVATRRLANPDAEVCACVGAGPVSKACFDAIRLEAKNLKELVIYDLFKEKAQAWADDVTAKTGLAARAADSLEEAVRSADIISVAASGLKPVDMQNDWLKPGSLMILTGRCNVDEDYFSSARVLWDNPMLHEVNYESELERPENERFTNRLAVQIYKMAFEKKLPPIKDQPGLGDVILGKAVGRSSHDQRICFVTGGMIVWDLGWSFELLQNAKKLGIGQILKLWDSPALA